MASVQTKSVQHFELNNDFDKDSKSYSLYDIKQTKLEKNQIISENRTNSDQSQKSGDLTQITNEKNVIKSNS